MTYSPKKINVTVQMGQGQFGEDGYDTVTLKGLRCTVDIAKSGMGMKEPLFLRIYGLEQQMMNQLTRVGRISWSGAVNNLVSVDAGDDSGMSNIYQGSIYFAQTDYRAMPNVSFNIEAAAGWFDSVKVAQPRSYRGSVPVATILKDIASSMTPPLAFVNHGVTTSLSNPALWGSLWDQLVSVANAANICYAIDGGQLTIWPLNGDRGNDPIMVSAATGMVGYPAINANSIEVTTELNPAIQVGSVLHVHSDILPTQGHWRVAQIAYNLASEMPGGPWFQSMTCYSPDATDLFL